MSFLNKYSPDLLKRGLSYAMYHLEHLVTQSSTARFLPWKSLAESFTLPGTAVSSGDDEDDGFLEPLYDEQSELNEEPMVFDDPEVPRDPKTQRFVETRKLF